MEDQIIEQEDKQLLFKTPTNRLTVNLPTILGISLQTLLDTTRTLLEGTTTHNPTQQTLIFSLNLTTTTKELIVINIWVSPQTTIRIKTTEVPCLEDE
jgi:hypothetical protein